MRFFNPGPVAEGKKLVGSRRNFSLATGTGASRDVYGADGAVAVVVSAKSRGPYGGRRGNSVYNVLIKYRSCI